MSDPYTAQGASRMFPGTLGGQAGVATPISLTRRRRPTPPAVAAAPADPPNWEDQSSVFGDQIILPVPSGNDPGCLICIVLYDPGVVLDVVGFTEITTDLHDSLVSIWRRVRTGTETNVTVNLSGNAHLAAMVGSFPVAVDTISIDVESPSSLYHLSVPGSGPSCSIAYVDSSDFIDLDPNVFYPWSDAILIDDGSSIVARVRAWGHQPPPAGEWDVYGTNMRHVWAIT